MIKVLLFSIIVALAGCAHNPERIVIEKEKLYIPDFDSSTFKCPEKPSLSKEEINSPGFTQKDVSLFILELSKRGDICASKLKNISRQIERARQVIEKQDEKQNNE